jgi:methylmalonyl-CoA mutase C-terminal domain/subunit
MTKNNKTRIMLAKFGLDGHSNGIRIVANWLRDAGYEVIYMGFYNTAEGIIKAAQAEGVDIIGGSFSEGSHLFYCKKLLKLAEDNGLDNVKFVVGGVIPPDEITMLKDIGVKEVFTPGTPKEIILNGIRSLS